MAYQSVPQRVLAGSMNLSLPSDKLPDGDSSILQNFRVNTQGELVSVPGCREIGNAPGTIHSLYRVGNYRYGGALGSLYYGTQLSTLVDSGFDGQPLGFAAMQKSLWVMNRGKQIRTRDVITPLKWGVDAPAVAPTVTTNVPTSINFVTFQASAGQNWKAYRFEGENTIDVPTSYAPYSRLETYLKVPGDVAGKYQTRLEPISPTISTLIEGVDSDGDVLEVSIYLEDPDALQSSFIIELFSSGPSGLVHAYSIVDRVNFDPQPQHFTKIRVLRKLDPSYLYTSDPNLADLQAKLKAAQDSNDQETAQNTQAAINTLYNELLTKTPHFIADIGFDWNAIHAISFQCTLSSPSSFGFFGAKWIGGPSSSLQGDLAYYATFATGDTPEHESNGSPAASVTVNRNRVSLILPVSPDPQVTKRYVYRAGGGLSEPLRVLTISDNITRNLVADNVSNDEAQINYIKMPTDADPPPPARSCLGPHWGRIIAWSTAAHPNRYWWSNVAEPWKFPGALDEAEGQWQDCGDDEEEIFCVTSHGRSLWFYKEKSFWVLHGDPDEADPEKTSSKLSLLGKKAVCSAGVIDYAASSDGREGPGIYAVDGDNEVKISAVLDPIFRGEWASIGRDYIPPMLREYASTSVIEFCNGQVWFSYAAAGANPPNNVTLIYNTWTRHWSMRKLAFGAGGFTTLYNEGQGSSNAFIGAVGTRFYELEMPQWHPSDAGFAIPLIWQSRFIDAGVPDQQKTIGVLRFRYRTCEEGSQQPSTITVKLIYDDGGAADAETVATLSSATWARAEIRLNNGEGRKAFNVAVRVESNALSTVHIRDVFLDMYVEGKPTAAFDSGVVQLAGGYAGEIEQIEIEADAPAAIAYKVWTDLPGGVFSIRADASLPVATGRRTQIIEFPRDARPIGRTGRVIVTSSQTFTPYRIRLKIRPVPVYLEPPDTYELEIDLGQPHMFREIEFDGFGSATATLALELPDQNIATRETISIDTSLTTGGRRPWNQRLKGNNKGQIVRVTISGTFRLWEMRIFARRLGVAADWSWISFPVPKCPENFSYLELPVS